MKLRNKIDSVVVVFLWLLLMIIYRGINVSWTDGSLLGFLYVGVVNSLIVFLQAGTSIIAWILLNKLFKKAP
jgi:hypothetical protein